MFAKIARAAALAVVLTATNHAVAQEFGATQAIPPIRIITRSTGNAASPVPTGLTPAQITAAYGLNLVSGKGAGQVIGIVDAFDDPNIEADLAVFSAQFGLPACTTANGCFKKAFGSGSVPAPNTGWATEIALDVEWSHAIAPLAKIVLVEAASASLADLFKAVDVAVANGAGVVSMSFGGGENFLERLYDSHFKVPGVVFFASSGDRGNAASYPAASPYVVSVGGTTLKLSTSGVYGGETAWSCTRSLNCILAGGTGGGVSSIEPEPAYQSAVQQTGFRVIPDVSFDADPASGVPVYDTYGSTAWLQVGGTSFSSPAWAGIIAIANSLRVGAGKQRMNTTAANNVFTALYSVPANLHDITSGTNGNCGAECTASSGFDALTGLGTPVANALIPSLVAIP